MRCGGSQWLIPYCAGDYLEAPDRHEHPVVMIVIDNGLNISIEPPSMSTVVDLEMDFQVPRSARERFSELWFCVTMLMV